MKNLPTFSEALKAASEYANGQADKHENRFIKKDFMAGYGWLYAQLNATEAKQITFDELVKHGLNYPGVNINNGMPWSFQYEGFNVTHENDDLYLISVPNRPPVRFNRNCVLFTNEKHAYVK